MQLEFRHQFNCLPNNKEAIEKIEGVNEVFSGSFDLLFDQPLFKQTVDKETFCSSNVQGRVRAFVKAQDGCNNRCSYCVVPLVRGPSKSCEFSSVIKEAESLVKAGHREIVLTGVCLGSFGRDLSNKASLADLLCELESIDGLWRIRLSSIEPVDISKSLIHIISRSKKICPHLHIPFQSGDDKVLAAMNRKMAVKDYINIIENARAAIKNFTVTCDIIVGFPEETRNAFVNTENFLKVIKPLNMR